MENFFLKFLKILIGVFTLLFVLILVILIWPLFVVYTSLNQLFQLHSALVPFSDLLSKISKEPQTRMIVYSIEASADNLDDPIFECHLVDKLNLDANDTKCPDYAIAWINNFVYQEAVNFKPEAKAESWENLSLTGIFYLYSEHFSSIGITNQDISDSTDFRVYNMAINGETEVECSGFNLGTICQNQRPGIKERIKLMKVILGNSLINCSGTINSNDTTNETVWMELLNVEFDNSTSLKEIENNLLQFDASRKLMCKCREKFSTIPEDFAELECLIELKIRSDFLPFLAHPFCFGANTFQ